MIPAVVFLINSLSLSLPPSPSQPPSSSSSSDTQLESGEQPSLSSGLSDAPWLNRDRRPGRPGSLYHDSTIEYE